MPLTLYWTTSSQASACYSVFNLVKENTLRLVFNHVNYVHVDRVRAFSFPSVYMYKRICVAIEL